MVSKPPQRFGLKERETGAHIPIIALTARTMQEDRDRCLAAGMDAFITKPIKAVEFLQVVEAVAAGRAGVSACDPLLSLTSRLSLRLGHHCLHRRVRCGTIPIIRSSTINWPR